MVMVASAILPIDKGNIDLKKWLTEIEQHFKLEEVAQIREACALVQNNCEDLKTPLQLSCINQSLEIANLLLSLNLDYETITASILYPALQYFELGIEDIKEQFSTQTSRLLQGALQMDNFANAQNNNSAVSQIDNYRRMLLAMVDDVRIVLLKLVERTITMRYINHLTKSQQQTFSRQTMDIYAPLANRLGILELKWELEDLAFAVLQAEDYKALAKHLNERRLDREYFIQNFLKTLQKLLSAENVEAQTNGRVKHIYSIFGKMQRKGVDYDEIYDVNATRILVDNIEDCYKALSIVHDKWPHVADEFDDYIATPKSNGYKSIHTVVITPEGKKVEVQIRTHEMHQENELGVAAHWVYKEGSQEDSYQRKIAWLRQLLDWQRDVADSSEIPEAIAQGITESRIYVFTPDSAVISLPKGSTPLDFAYYIHTEIGHKCRGAKVNNRMVPLTYQLKLGDRIDILTGNVANPSRDWLNPQLGYLTSSRAKTKIHSWFKKRDYEQNINEGRAILQRETKRFNLNKVDVNHLASRFHLNNTNDVLAAIGCGDIRIPQLTGALQDLLNQESATKVEMPTFIKNKSQQKSAKGILVDGVDNLLTSISHCCKPLPGEPIIGFITVGRGVTIHHQDCGNIKHAQKKTPERLIDVSWGNIDKQHYTIDLIIEANDRTNLLRDITKIIGDQDIQIAGLNCNTNQQKDATIINLSVEIGSQRQLEILQNKLHNIKDIISVKRV